MKKSKTSSFVDKGIINNIIQSRIIPVLNYNIEFLPCTEGDLLIIHVNKKKDMPHAYINSKKGFKIKNRIYYVKTPHDKRLVSDNHLKYLFREDEINIFHPFEIVLYLDIPELTIPYFDLKYRNNYNLIPILYHEHH